jgi:hypothetical protein
MPMPCGNVFLDQPQLVMDETTPPNHLMHIFQERGSVNPTWNVHAGYTHGLIWHLASFSSRQCSWTKQITHQNTIRAPPPTIIGNQADSQKPTGEGGLDLCTNPLGGNLGTATKQPDLHMIKMTFYRLTLPTHTCVIAQTCNLLRTHELLWLVWLLTEIVGVVYFYMWSVITDDVFVMSWTRSPKGLS